VKVVAVSAGESPRSKTHALVRAVTDEIIDLSSLSAGGLLGRRPDEAVDAAVARATSADVLVVASPIYRATYTGALKCFFDRFEPGALRGKVVVLVATALIAEHYLALDTGGRALVASLEGTTAPTVVYATRDDFTDGAPSERIVSKLRDAIAEAQRLAT
jgi:FMN reductase